MRDMRVDHCPFGSHSTLNPIDIEYLEVSELSWGERQWLTSISHEFVRDDLRGDNL